jgi:hypothetical protein
MKYLYHDKETNTDIEANPERWVWGVVYKDGTELKQFAEDGTFHKFIEINQKEVDIFAMFRFEDMTKIFTVRPDGAQIFHFYRNSILQAGTEDEKRTRVYVFGTRTKDEAIYNYILPDDTIIKTRGDSLIID